MRIASSLWSDEAIWQQSTNLVDRRNVSLARYLLRIWKQAGRCDALILNGALGWRDHYCDLLAALVVKLRPHRPWVVLADCTWEPGSRALSARMPKLAGVLPVLSRHLIRLIDHDKQIYCVLSSAEKASFANQWRVDTHRVAFTPFCNTLFGEVETGPAADYAFAGGNSLRDYPLLIAAFDRLDMPLRIAANFDLDHARSNVVSRALPHNEYMDELRCARLVLVPLAPSVRSAGQQTYLNAMALGKLTIVNDAIGVRDYIDDGKTGIVVASDSDAIAAAVQWASDPANRTAVDAIRHAGRKSALEQFSLKAYLSSILDIARTAATGAGSLDNPARP